MNLAPKWAKAAAILGLKMQLEMLKAVRPGAPALILTCESEIARIETMKD